MQCHTHPTSEHQSQLLRRGESGGEADGCGSKGTDRQRKVPWTNQRLFESILAIQSRECIPAERGVNKICAGKRHLATIQETDARAGKGLTREIHEEVKANPVENKYKCAGPHGISGSQEGKECSQRDTV